MADILLIGATGYSGRATARYLLSHPERNTFTLALAARSRTKLENSGLKIDENVRVFVFDLTDEAELEAAVRQVKVVVNAAGPYCRTGSPVVSACARNGVHYVDIAGERSWIFDIIQQYDYVATTHHAIIVPACGFDSVPSDIVVYAANKTLKAHDPAAEIETSASAVEFKGAAAGGTFATVIAAFEEVPRFLMELANKPYALSPVRGTPYPRFRWTYALPYPLNFIKGGYWLMASTNRGIVERTWGLQQYALESTSPGAVAGRDPLLAYGRKFTYDEFMRTSGTISAFFLSLAVAFGGVSLALFSPLRWLFERIVTQPGSGPSEQELKGGSFTLTNLSVSISPPASSPAYVRTVVRGPGPLLFSNFALAESALCLLNPASLPGLAQNGGILTPMSAFGDVLIERLEQRGLVSIESAIITGEEEAKKTR
ncbi:NAD-P-binding protein [Amylostereum chailletii]|nr:NAD-P-binding protein [Amylostereum chailletii]